MDCAYVIQRVTALASIIAATEAAIDAIAVGGLSDYSLDTGQTVQKVTQIDLPRLNQSVDLMLNRMEVLCARCPQTAGQAGTLIAHAATNIHRGDGHS